MTARSKRNPNEIEGCYFDIGEIEKIDGIKLKMRHKNVLWALDSYGEDIYPSRADIARKGGCSPQTIDSALRDLENLGVLLIMHRDGTSSEYALNRKFLRELANDVREVRDLEKKRRKQEFNRAKNAWRIRMIEIQEGTNPESS
jgi:DNA-binding PadR family transcriptional regulator